MATAVGLNMKMTADTSGLGRGMNRAEKLLNGIGKNARSAASSLRVLATIQVGGALLKGLNSVSSAITGYVADVRQAAGAIQNFAQISNSSAAEFQRFAAAAGTVGIENEKLADIFKDVNDRIGDFLQTGGGPMADFFDNVAPKVGVTVDQFRNLSGPEALQLYVKTLQDANLSQQEFTFYLEAMASDTTALIPLLKNGGEAFQEIANRAERLGIVLSEDQVGAIREMNSALTLVQKTFEGIIGQVTANLAPVITQIAEEFLSFVEGFEGVNGEIGGNALADALTNAFFTGADYVASILDPWIVSLLGWGEYFGQTTSQLGGWFEYFQVAVELMQAAFYAARGFFNEFVAKLADWAKLLPSLLRPDDETLDAFGDGLRRSAAQDRQAASDAFMGRNRTRPNLAAGPLQAFIAEAAARFAERNSLSAQAQQERDRVTEMSRPQFEIAEEEKARAKAAEKAEKDRIRAIEKADEAIAKAEKDRAKRAAEIEDDRLDALSRRSTQALEVSDIRSGGLSEVFRIAAGREDPAVAEYRKQLAQLQKIEQRIADLRADKVKIIGGAGRAA